MNHKHVNKKDKVLQVYRFETISHMEEFDWQGGQQIRCIITANT